MVTVQDIGSITNSTVLLFNSPLPLPLLFQIDTMGWFWGSSSEGDAVSKLDPKLKEFLDSDKTPEYKPVTTSTSSPKPAPTPIEDSKKPLVPAESLFQDGRYAHLWKTYTPQTVLEARGKTDQEKLSDLMDAYNERRSEVSRAALDNCAVEYEELHHCYRHGSLADRMTNCRGNFRKLDRCFTMQQNFLKALGYLSVGERDPEREERIQMHADKLFHQMLAQEKMIEEAKKDGKAEPRFAPLFSPESLSAAMKGQPVPLETQSVSDPDARPAVWKELSEAARATMEERLKKKTGLARQVEMQTITAEIEADKEFGAEFGKVMDDERRSRHLRREQGKETIGDTIKRWWGWN